ncbi:coiled-coil domain-containing protein 12-like [Tropilaelaps mercedesae]|uniref:Coiled-coil domain-containing protein 12-like n=1 Tax=Tropilaelaps mercedesae TaxID=418985 RepID=A0A1V9XSY6_9ACAR|nr:coiled-coil domain-containing protein 12-like [Tropilaelaps mercedesae]
MESRDKLEPTVALTPNAGTSTIGQGVENTLKRKERLRQLREQRKRRHPEEEAAEDADGSDTRKSEDQLGGQEPGGKPGATRSDEAIKDAAIEPLPRPVFRTYRPADETLKTLELPDSRPENIDQQVKENLVVLAAENILDRDINIDTLQSHKPDWDIKRGIAKQLEKLERRTKRAIAELVRERLQADKHAKIGLAQAVKNAQPEPADDSGED